MLPIDRLITALQSSRPHLAGDLTRLKSRVNDEAIPPGSLRPTLEQTTTRSGATSLRYGERYLHSSIDPEREATRLAAEIGGERRPDLLFCFGLGFGYQIEAIRREHPTLPIVAVLADGEELAVAAAAHDSAWWERWGPDRLIDIEEPSMIRELIGRYGAFSPHIVALPGFRAVFSAQWSSAAGAIATWRSREQVNRNTLRRFGKRWVRNTIHNLARYGIVPGIDGLEEIAADVPAVVFGAGPTLDEVAPLCTPYLDSLLVIAVDTALPALARHGVKADIAVIADPQYWNSRHIDTVAPGGTVLVAESATYPRVLRLWRGPRLVFASLFPLGEFIDRRVGRIRRLGAGGSVATSAWDLARRLGSRAIGLAGVDLSFPDLRTHCADSFFERRLTAKADRLHPAEHGLARYLHGGVPTVVARADGERVVSDQRMMVYRSWFAEQATRDPDTQTVLLSPKSGAIPGIPYEPATSFFDRVTANVHGKNKVTALLGKRAASPAPVDGEAGTEAVEILAELDASFVRVERHARAGLELCKRLNADGAENPAVLAELDRIDHALLRAGEGEMAGFIAAESVSAAAERSAGSVSDSIAQAAEIYAAVEESCEFHRRVIARFSRLKS